MARSPPPYHQLAMPYGSSGPQNPVPPYTQRQRLSPSNPSPYSSPQIPAGTLPNAGFFSQGGSQAQSPPSHNQPYLNGNHYATSPQPSPGIDFPMAPSTPGTMGPPSKPVEDKPVDVNDLGDVLAGSGVDIREEEANLVGARRLPNGLPAGPTTTNGFLGGQPQPYPVYSLNQPGPRSSFFGAGTLSQAPVTQEQLQAQHEERQKQIIRGQAYRTQQHEHSPFLESGQLRHRMRKAADTRSLKLLDPTTAPTAQTPAVTVGHGGSLAVVNGVSRNVGSGQELFTTLSLACKDRVKALLEHATWLARSRRQASYGEVPSDLQDIAIGQGPAEVVEITEPSSAQSRKRSFAEFPGDESTALENRSKKVKTKRFHNQDMIILNQLAENERRMEEERVKKRAARNMANIAGATSSGTATPGPGIVDTSALAKVTKAQKKAAEAAKNMSEAEQKAATTEAAAKALGGSGGPAWLKGGSGGSKKKGAGWLTSKQPGSTSFSAPPSRAPSMSQVPKTTTTAPVTENRMLQVGESREDVAGNRDLQVRDVIGALELDKKEKKALSKAYNKQDLKE